MLSVQQARRLLLEDVRTLGTERVRFDECLGRVLAEAVDADRDFPPTDRSAMDGFAVRASDLETPGETLRIVGEVRAGQDPAGRRVGPREALRVFTGAVMPEGADTVVMVERTVEDRDRSYVRIDVVPRPGEHVRPRASEYRRGERVLTAGTLLEPMEVAALASVGCVRPQVSCLPEVSVLSTGDEVVPPDRDVAPHQVRNSNGPVLLAQLAAMGLRAQDLGIAPDTPGALTERMRVGLAGDLLLLTGGVSVGEYDLVGKVLRDAGLQLLFHRVAMKPGKPILAGRVDRCLVVGLPGNPLSAFVGFVAFVAPVLRRMLGRDRCEPLLLAAELAEPLRARPGRETYHLARLEVRDGRLAAEPVSSTGSGDVLSLARADCLVITPAAGADLAAGDRVRILPLRFV